MNTALVLLTKLDSEQLKFFVKKISANIDLSLDEIFPKEKLEFYREELELGESDLRTLEEFTKYIYIQAASNKNFAAATEILEKVGMEEEKIKVFEGVFQSNAQGIVDSVKRRVNATDDLVSGFGFRISLPVIQSIKPISQELTFNQKIKFNYSSDVRNPLTTIDFTLKRDLGDDRPCSFKVDLEKHQLVQLFEEVEKIKEHLDKIYGN